MSLTSRFRRWLRRRTLGFLLNLRWLWRRFWWLARALWRTPAAALQGLWQLARHRYVVITAGWLLIVIGTLIGPIPGPWSLPLVALGAVMILRRSLWARRRFVRLSQRYPRLLGPLRRFLTGKRDGARRGQSVRRSVA
ncbi:MAG: hypothetical protein RLO50_06935 [Azospirillaceae bacterium]